MCVGTSLAPHHGPRGQQRAADTRLRPGEFLRGCTTALHHCSALGSHRRSLCGVGGDRSVPRKLTSPTAGVRRCQKLRQILFTKLIFIQPDIVSEAGSFFALPAGENLYGGSCC